MTTDELPQPPAAFLYVHGELRKAHHLVCVLMEANAGLQAEAETLRARVAELEGATAPAEG